MNNQEFLNYEGLSEYDRLLKEFVMDTTTEALPISRGEGVDTVVINQGSALGSYAIAGGSTDIESIKPLLGEGLVGLINQYGSNINNLSDIAIQTILNLVQSDLTVAEFRRMVNIFPSVAEGVLAISYGVSNRANASGSIALGYSNIAGGKGYYISSIDANSKKIILSSLQDSAVEITDIAWAAGDRLFIVNDERYWAVINSVNGNEIILNEIPFQTLKDLGNFAKPSEHSVINIDKPEAGIVTFGWESLGIGAFNTTFGNGSWALGYQNIVAGDFGVALGQENIAGYSAFALGIGNQALGKASVAEGNQNTASGNGAHAEGGHTSAEGRRSHAEGESTRAIGDRSHAEGNETIAHGNNSHAEGTSTTAMGNSAHAEGTNTMAEGNNSHAEGANNVTNGNNSHAEGWNNVALGGASHAEGEAYEHTDGTVYQNIAEGAGSHSEGQGARAVGLASHAEGGGEWDKSKKEFVYTVAQGTKSHAEGVRTTAKGTGSHTEGYKTVAEGIYSHAEGISTVAAGNHSHVEGANGVALGNNSHVEGWNCSTAQGAGASHAGGEASQADAYGAFVHGAYLRATEKYQAVFGKGNVSNSNALFIIGNAELDDDDRVVVPSNAFEVLQNGSIIVGGVELTPTKLEKLIKFIDSIEEY